MLKNFSESVGTDSSIIKRWYQNSGGSNEMNDAFWDAMANESLKEVMFFTSGMFVASLVALPIGFMLGRIVLPRKECRDSDNIRIKDNKELDMVSKKITEKIKNEIVSALEASEDIATIKTHRGKGDQSSIQSNSCSPHIAFS